VLAFIVELTFAVLGFFFLLVAVWSGWGLVHMLRSGQRNQAYLQAANEDEPLQLEHLSPGLRRLIRESRLLRISLEAPARQVFELRQGELHQDLDALDNALMDITRQVMDWVDLVDALGESDRQTMRDLGVDAQRVRGALELEGLAFERRKVYLVDQPPLDKRLEAIGAELKRIETALQFVSLKPYR